ncbi:5-amino-6-(5-phosphoribosylamino)uracil reductase [Dethiosulfatarculus sandiegensis]|uniref:Riboflavin biosynthesis protein RibD n=2 Tax=Dethiosulfatarculus sandiegensis TaxID=1429043 RepID=A0A0D2IZD2_9BACT|nr:5-amino-6-(5-phosphoribosylamino)uracil reductase [Dethiosulfatarculus sandiegensis]
MRRALRLARKGLGRSSPNPAVGAVVVNRGKVVGQGFHALAGTPHAEVLALRQAGEEAKGGEIFVTLEPCHHQGRTPPCTRAILEAGIKRVVFGASDPNPRVAGGGGAFLASKGLEVLSGVLVDDCLQEHRFFFKHITTGRPYVLLKTAATLDGKTAAASGDSRWITGEQSRRYVHRLRNLLDCICVGSGTLRADDPSLTCRLKGGRNPLRVVVDTGLSIELPAKVLDASEKGGCLIACGPEASQAKIDSLTQIGAKVVRLPLLNGRVDLGALLDHLGKLGVTSMLLEGGATLAFSFVSQGLVDEVNYFFAPKLIGGQTAPSMLGGEGFTRMARAVQLEKPVIRRFGPDIMLSSRVLPS